MWEKNNWAPAKNLLEKLPILYFAKKIHHRLLESKVHWYFNVKMENIYNCGQLVAMAHKWLLCTGDLILPYICLFYFCWICAKNIEKNPLKHDSAGVFNSCFKGVQG
jgi:hypothetical protein